MNLISGRCGKGGIEAQQLAGPSLDSSLFETESRVPSVNTEPVSLRKGRATAEPQVDVALTVALAEYTHLREMRLHIDTSSAARFNYFVAVVTAGTAVSAGLLGTATSTPTRVGAAAVIGGLVLLLGVVSFGRMVYYRMSRAEYTAALDALRTYLVRRAPDVAPYVVLPTIQDPPDVPVPGGTPGPLSSPSKVGLAMTVGLINSALLAGVAGGLVWRWGRTPPPFAVATAAVVFLVAAAVHRAIELRMFRQTSDHLHAEMMTRFRDEYGIPPDG